MDIGCVTRGDYTQGGRRSDEGLVTLERARIHHRQSGPKILPLAHHGEVEGPGGAALGLTPTPGAG